MLAAIGYFLWWVAAWVVWGYILLPIAVTIDNLAVKIGGKNKLFIELFSFFGILVAGVLVTQGLLYVSVIIYAFIAGIPIERRD